MKLNMFWFTKNVIVLSILLHYGHIHPLAAMAVTTVEKTVAVAGATGRTGSKVVTELLDKGINVVALVRDMKKADATFSSSSYGNRLTVRQVDLTSDKEVSKALTNCDAAIWCATGFSDSPGIPFLEKIMKIFGLVFAQKQSIDIIGIQAVAKALRTDGIEAGDNSNLTPKVVMLSSAGVTRTKWDDEKKAMFKGSADIPIVRLNPFGILDLKAESEEKLRQSGISYCIVRPCGLNDQWPENSRSIFSQGDVAVGRMNRKDVAKILVECLETKEAAGKTFEVFSLSGYQPSLSLATALSRLDSDNGKGPSIDSLKATYSALQQLLPGEKQDSAALAMGQTYEQLDKGEVGRLGKRGEENAEAAAPKPSS